jgi:hypothetical protein
MKMYLVIEASARLAKTRDTGVLAVSPGRVVAGSTLLDGRIGRERAAKQARLSRYEKARATRDCIIAQEPG